MTLSQRMKEISGRILIAATVVLPVTACAPVDDTIGSRLSQPSPGAPPRKPVEAGDIAIVGQYVAHEIMALPVISGAAVPPLVEFKGVTSIVDKPVDTAPYTELLRDRLLLLTREKLRFQEHTLPMYVAPSKKKKKTEEAAASSSEVEYQILAELHGQADDDTYKIQVQFVDVRTNEVLFDGLYRIRKEEEEAPSAPENEPAQPAAPQAQPAQTLPSYEPAPTAPPIAPTSPTL